MNAPDSPLNPIEIVLLARLLVPRKTPYRNADLTRALERIFDGRLPRADLEAAADRSVTSLRARGLLEDKLQLSERGRAAALDALGLAAVSPRLRWPAVLRGPLTALALGANTEARTVDKVKGAERLPGLILARAESLCTPELPTTTQSLDALVWRALGVESAAPISRGALHTFVLSRRLQSSRGSPAQLARRAAALHVRSPRTDPDSLRCAAIAEWAGAVQAGPAKAPLAGVLAFARDPRVPRFGDDLVYIAGLFEALSDELRAPWPTLDAFKAELLAAHRAAELTLVRADLVSAMDRALLDRSAVDDRGTPLHFLRRPHEDRP